MASNVVTLPYDDLSEADSVDDLSKLRKEVENFMGDINEWCEQRGVDIGTTEYKHQAAVIMTQLQIILMGTK